MVRAIAIPAWRGLTRRPLQTGLLLFALTLALAGTMTLMAVLSGIEVQMRRDLARVGLDVVNIHVSPQVKHLLRSPLRVRDCTRIGAEFGGAIAPFRVQTGMARNDAPTADRSAPILLLSTTPEWEAVVPLEFREGRFFRRGEEEVCVLDEWVASSLFGPEGTAVGRAVHVQTFGGRRSLQVVGVMRDPFEVRKRFDELDVTGSARSRMLRMMEFKSIYLPGTFENPGLSVHGAVLKVRASDDPVEVARQITGRLLPDESLWVWARAWWVGHVLDAASLGLHLADAIWLIVLVVTGIMIMTVSLVAVRERYREIAIRRTEGAGRMQLALQLLTENLLLSCVAGGLAVGLARLAGEALRRRYISWPPAYLASDLLLALVCGFLLGGLATLLPALRAARIDPVAVFRDF
jgi:putative ABC transport system permease protein